MLLAGTLPINSKVFFPANGLLGREDLSKGEWNIKENWG